MLYNYKNCYFYLSGADILATDVNLSIDAKNTPIYREETKKNAYTYSQDDAPDVKFTVSYYLTGLDPIKQYVLGGNSDLPITGNFCGLYFNSGYITSYSLKSQPNSLAKIDLELTVLDPLRGAFTPVTPVNQQALNPLNFSGFYFSGTLTGQAFDSNTNNILSFSYQLQREFNKYLREGSSAYTGSDARGYLGKRSQSVNFEIDNVDFTLPNSGVDASVQFYYKNGNTIYDVFQLSGILNSKRGSLSSQGFFKSEFSLKQDYSHSKPVITDFTPRYILPGAAVTINGLNFINVKNVYFGNLLSPSFSNPSTVLITATAPANIKGAVPIIIETDESYQSTNLNFKTAVSRNNISVSQPFIGL